MIAVSSQSFVATKSKLNSYDIKFMKVQITCNNNRATFEEVLHSVRFRLSLKSFYTGKMFAS